MGQSSSGRYQLGGAFWIAASVLRHLRASALAFTELRHRACADCIVSAAVCLMMYIWDRYQRDAFWDTFLHYMYVGVTVGHWTCDDWSLVWPPVSPRLPNIGRLSLASLWVAKLSTSFGLVKGRNVTTAGWQVTLWAPHGMWVPVLMRSVVNCCAYLYPYNLFKAGFTEDVPDLVFYEFDWSRISVVFVLDSLLILQSQNLLSHYYCSHVNNSWSGSQLP